MAEGGVNDCGGSEEASAVSSHQNSEDHVLEEASIIRTFFRPYGIRRTDHATPLYSEKLALTSPTSGGRSVGIVRSRTQATELVILMLSM
jgi:hypothetical protein